MIEVSVKIALIRSDPPRELSGPEYLHAEDRLRHETTIEIGANSVILL
jgi:hypothetical protein